MYSRVRVFSICVAAVTLLAAAGCGGSADKDVAPVAEVTGAAFSQDGKRVITGSKDGTARLWNAETGAPLAVLEGHELYLRTRNGRFDLHWVDPFGGDTEEQVGEDKIVAPLPGTVVALLAEVGATLEKGAPILTLEVMKMEQTLRAPFAGVLKLIKCKVGDIVQEGVELAEVEPLAS